MKGLFIPEITAEMFRNGCLESIEALMAEGEIYDIEYSPQPSKDCISRKAVLDSLHRYFAEGFNEDRWWNSTYVLDAINKAPSVAPQPKEESQQKTGHWIEHKHGGIEHIECSKCKCWFLRKDLIRNSYCPNCGSRNHWEWELKMQEVKK